MARPSGHLSCRLRDCPIQDWRFELRCQRPFLGDILSLIDKVAGYWNVQGISVPRHSTLTFRTYFRKFIQDPKSCLKVLPAMLCGFRLRPQNKYQTANMSSVLARGLVFLLALLTASCDSTPDLSSLSWTLLSTNSREQFRGLAPIDDQTVWVSGTGGQVFRTTDGGITWAQVGPELEGDDTALEFRDIHAWSADRAVILSVRQSGDSRIYLTKNGGSSWSETFANGDSRAFYNCIAFDGERGMAVSDAVDGKIRLVETLDGGMTWSIVDPAGMPPAWEGEAQMAASGTCLTVTAGRWYIATGRVNPGRMFYSDGGYIWAVTNSTVKGSPTGGAFTVQFSDENHGIVLGGDYLNVTDGQDRAGWSEDGGQSWRPAVQFPKGRRSGSAWVRGLQNTAIAVGETGSDITVDGGREWHAFSEEPFDAVACIHAFNCWASGFKGRVARLDFGSY